MIMKAVYQMVTFDFKHVQTLHTISQLPISVMSRDKELVQLYGNEDYLLPYYQFLKHLASLITKISLFMRVFLKNHS